MVAVLAVVALLGIAAVVGSASDRGSTSDETSAANDSEGSMETSGEARSAPGATEESAPSDGGETLSDGDADATSAATEDVGGSDAVSFVAGAPPEAKIVRTGTLELEVDKGSFEAKVTELTRIATTAGGFISASETSALDDRPRGTVTLRVPVARFEEVVGQVGKQGDVLAVNTSSQDVTGEYTDVASRLKALQAERDQIQLVLGRAENIPDILAVRDRLAVVQSEIETLQGRQKVLDDQTSLSTLTVTLHEEGSPAVATVTAERSGFSKLWHDAAERFTDGVRSIALGLATLGPWLLLALLLFLPCRALWRRIGQDQHRTRPADGPPATTAD